MKCNIVHALVSLDVKNLFANVSVNETIDFNLKNIYNHSSLPLLKINPRIKKSQYLAHMLFNDHLDNSYTRD